jgi:DNA-binding MarR family transcriptional regulator
VTGRNERQTDTDFLREIALSPDPIVTAPELAERMDYTRAEVHKRLNDLVEQGLVRKRDVGSRPTVYWLSEAGRRKATEA